MHKKHPEMDRLTELQTMDHEILELQEQLNRYPAIWAEVKEDLRAKSQTLEELTSIEENRESERRKTEQELRLTTEKLKQYQAQQMMVKTSKELAALNQQVEAFKKSISRLEERGLELLSDEGAKEKIAEAQKVLDEKKAIARQERDRIRQQVQSKKERIEIIGKERERVSRQISGDAMAEYETTRRRHPENPVVPARNGSCTGCHFTILPNRLVELHRGEDLLRCDNCGRILSHDESFVLSQEPV